MVKILEETYTLPYVINEFSKIPDIVFVGGTSEYLQGVKYILRDIDISLPDPDLIKPLFGNIHLTKDDSFPGLSGNRAISVKHNILVDMWVDTTSPPYIITPEGYKCQTIDSMIELREKTIEFGKLQGHHLEKIKNNLERLKSWKQST